MSPRFFTPARHFYLPAFAVLSLLCICPWLSAQSPSVRAATSAKEADAHCARAETLAMNGQWASAIAEYKAAYAYDKTARPEEAAAEVKGIGSVEAEKLNKIAVTYEGHSQYDKALTYFQQILPIERQNRDKFGEAATLDRIGIAYATLSQYDKALTYFQQELPIRRQIGDNESEAETLNNIGSTYDNLSQYDKALTYYQQELHIQRQGDSLSNLIATPNSPGLSNLGELDEAQTLSNIGVDYFHLSQYDKSLTYYQQALPIIRRGGDKSNEAAVLSNIGGAYDSLSQYDKALIYYQKALAIEKKVGDTKSETATLALIQKVQSRQSQKGKGDVPASTP